MLAQAAAQPAPAPQYTEIQARNISCVATLGIVADEQRRGKAPSLRFPNMMDRGKKYAGNIGLKLMEETGQNRAAIAAAIKANVEAQTAESTKAASSLERRSMMDRRMAMCMPLLDAEVPPVDPTPDDYRFCAAIIGIAADEIAGREGKGSMNAKMMQGLSAQLSEKYQAAQYGDDIKNDKLAQADIAKEKQTQIALAKSGGGLEALAEKQGEEKYQRCIFLGE